MASACTSSPWRDDDEHGLAGGQLRLEFLGADPRDAQLPEKELAARHLDAQVKPEGAGDYRDGPGAQAVGKNGSLGQLIVEGVAQTDIKSHPEHGPKHVEDHEAPSRHAERPREGLPDAVDESGKNFAIKRARSRRGAKVSSRVARVSGRWRAGTSTLSDLTATPAPISYQMRSPSTVPASANAAANHKQRTSGAGQGASTGEEGSPASVAQTVP
jgi:hypothetical protein